MSDTAPTPRLEDMLRSLANVQEQAPPKPPPTPPKPADEAVEAPAPITEAQLFARFRMDMAAAGLAVYEITEEMLGLTHEGPAVNVRDPLQATNATRLILATHALGTGLWRLYPVLEPVTI